MKVHQIFTGSSLRNFTYFIELSNGDAYIIDPWDAKGAIAFLKINKLKLKAIINTHEHWDHTQGNQELVDVFNCEVWAHEVGRGKIPGQKQYLKPGQVINLSKRIKLKAIDTPGHCEAHMCYILIEGDKPYCVFSGDILFNAGVGNCYNGGDAEDLYRTVVNEISTLPDDILIYPGHEYLENNLRFTLDREPLNMFAKQLLDKCRQIDVYKKPFVANLSDEKKMNVFLRLDNDELKKRLDLDLATDKEIFIELRALRDKW